MPPASPNVNFPDKVDRSILPIPDKPQFGLTTYDAKDPDTKYPPIREIRPPPGAPNVLVVLIDDAGFGSSSAFGGPCYTPTFEKLASEGLRYTRFHTTALCSPTRQALLTGRNHHSAGMGGVTEIATSAPGYSSLCPNTKAPLAMTMKLNGYSTAQFGKCHEVPVWQTSPLGPFDHWPANGGGFEYFYGFIGGEANQWYPGLFNGTVPIEPPRTPEQGYHLTEDLADKAVAWIRQQRALMPDKPFFVYFAPGATHAPHHVPKEWADKYKGKFAHGWDKQREITFQKQKQLGVIPQTAELTKRHAEIPAWDAVDPKLKPVLEREMEVYAGFMEHTDHQVGRLITAIEDLGIIDDTLIFVIIGDNGASAEGSIQGSFNEMIMLNGVTGVETPEFLLSKIDKWGSPDAYNHYAVGWAWAMDTPYQWTKQVASHWGGTRNGTIIHWPKRIKEKNGIRNQFCHVIDIAPTVLEAAGIPEPIIVNSVMQSPYEGKSMLYTLNDANAPERRDVQYFEMFGNRGIYYKGWSAVTKHRTPWSMGEPPPFDKDNWELYDGSKDWTQAHDLSKEMPEKLAELQRLWLIEATKYNVLPLDDRTYQRFNPDLAGRPQLIKGNSQLFFAGMGRLSESSVLNVKNKSWSVTAELVVPPSGANGVIVHQAGKFGGWSLYAKAGKAKFAYNFLGLKLFTAEATKSIPSGEHQVRMEFKYDGGGLAKGGNVTLYYDGQKTGEGRIEVTQPMCFSADEGVDIGHESGTNVTPDYSTRESEFTGKIRWVQIDLGEDSHDHLITPEQRLHLAMNRQ
ncbi:MAG TPA: arylsulfatase [Methylomirabilota bacterium]|nr:arylsulfatase [Methylomirabilota bacterium]